MYEIIVPKETYESVCDYKTSISDDGIHPGRYLSDATKNLSWSSLDTNTLIRKLLSTKIPRIFAESGVHGDGSDWRSAELAILGDVSVACPVVAYDDGQHKQPKVHSQPVDTTLLFVPGALLTACKDNSPDYKEVISKEGVCSDRYMELYRRRLTPVFNYANAKAKAKGQKAVITIPGLGCGQFAGRYRGQLGSLLEAAIKIVIGKVDCSHIDTIYYDPFDECERGVEKINDVAFITNPFLKTNSPVAQLDHIDKLLGPGVDGRELMHFSIVAWDHVSWPGNDFYAGDRVTDDGVKAAATDVMRHMTGVEGEYCDLRHQYMPPFHYRDWGDVVRKESIKFGQSQRILIDGFDV